MSKKKANEADEALDEPIISTPVSLLDELVMEEMQLHSRHHRLSNFIDSPEFSQVDQEERDRLLGQKTAMGHYLGILQARIEYHKAREQA